MISAKVIADTIHNGHRITSLQLVMPRFILAQFNTHRSFCLAEDVVLDFDLPISKKNGVRRIHKMTVGEFCDKWLNGIQNRLAKMNLRQFNEQTYEIQTTNVKNVYFNGVKPVFRLVAGSFDIEATAEHKILTNNGWKELCDIVVGVDKVRTYHYGTGVNPDKYRKINGIWVNTWNAQHKELIKNRQNGLCWYSNEPLGDRFDIHHIKPRHLHPELAFDLNNVVAVTAESHAKIHKKQGWQVGVALISEWETVTEITYSRDVKTYDIEVDSEFHNFFANGIVVHNSRSTASSRAIPTAKLIEQVRTNYVQPVQWGMNKAGMQSEQELEAQEIETAKEIWCRAAHAAADFAEQMAALGLHKQHANRIIEPYMWAHTIVTATEWANFFKLRIDDAAQPEIQLLAKEMKAAIDDSVAKRSHYHLPYIMEDEIYTYQKENGITTSEVLHNTFEHLAHISAARCARVSYLNHDQSEPDYKKDMELASRLFQHQHYSPFEHQAMAVSESNLQETRNFTGWAQYRALIGG